MELIVANPEEKILYFIGVNNKIIGVTENAIIQLISENTRWKLKNGMYFTKEEAEAKLKEGGVNDIRRSYKSIE